MTKREYKYHLWKKRKYGFKSYRFDTFTYNFHRNTEAIIEKPSFALFMPAKCQAKY